MDESSTPKGLLTRIDLASNQGSFRKIYHYKNNTLLKINNAGMNGEKVCRVDSFTLATLYETVKSQDCVFVMGYPQSFSAGQSFRLLKLEDFAFKFPDHKQPPFIEEFLLTHYVTRTINTFEQSPLVVFDYDASSNTPSHLQFTHPNELMSYLALNVHEDFGKLSYVATYSSSAGIYTASGHRLTDVSRFHIYFFIEKQKDIPRFKQLIEGHLLISHSYWTEKNKKGNDSSKLLLDLGVISPERLVYETRPVFNDGLSQNRPNPIFHEGELEAFDVSALKEDFIVEDLNTIARVNHVPLVSKTQSLSSLVGIKHDFKTFKYATRITLCDGTIVSCEEVEALLETKRNVSCYSPFRDENNPSCFISKNYQKVIYLHDMGVKTTYFVCDRPEVNYTLTQSLPKKLFPELKTSNNIKVPVVVKENIAVMLENYGITVRYNLMSKENDIVIPTVSVSLDNKSNVSFSKIQELCTRNSLKITPERLSSILLEIGDEHRYHPVQEWIAETQWDGVDRYEAFCETLNVVPSHEQFKEIVLLKVLQAIVAAAFEEQGIKFEYLLTLSGAQGIGKTSWIKRLLPQGMVLDGMSLDLAQKDSVKMAVSYAVTELGEVESTFRKSSNSDLKAFLSRQFDEIRMPYAAKTSKFGRRTVFMASVNFQRFLTDMSGNRRYWVLDTLSVDYEHDIDMQQLFAQVYAMHYLNDDPLYLSADETALQSELVSQNEVVEPLLEKLLTMFNVEYDGENESLGCYMTVTEILEAMGCATNKSDATKLGNLLKKYSLKNQKRSGYVKYLMVRRCASADLGQNLLGHSGPSGLGPMFP